MDLADVAAHVRADLERLVSVPSVHFPGFPEQPVRAAAELTAELLHDAGLANAELLDVPDGPPAVYGSLEAPPGAPTVLLYAHYDVQPAGPEELWSSPPFEPVERDGRLYGRGTADDKCGVALHAGLLRAFDGRPPVGIKLIVEGEEEFGGGTLERFVAAEPERFAADLVVIADGINTRVGEPTLTVSLRGLVTLDVEVRTLRAPVHSGLFGGAAPDALIALARMLATLHDADGAVAVPGLAGEAWSGRALDPAALRASAGVLDGVPLFDDDGARLAERLFTRPSITALGLDAPSVHGAPNALVPSARTRISARLAPSQDPDEAVEALVAHLRAVAPWGAEVDVRTVEAASGARLATGGPGDVAARRALERAYGRPATVNGVGGSIPLVTALTAAMPDAELILWGAADEGAQIHAANESVDLGDLARATRAQVHLIEELARGGV